MNKIGNAILIVFFIFMVNTALAVQSNYVYITATQGEEINRIGSFTGHYDRLFAAAEASGTAASWVTPKYINFGTVEPKDTAKQEYTIRIPENQNPGQYKIVWKYSCRFVDGYTCTPPSNTVILLTVKAKQDSPTTIQHEYISLILAEGEEVSKSLDFTANYDSPVVWADVSGNAASWVTPGHINYGAIPEGRTGKQYYTIKVPENQKPGYYEIIWTWGCRYSSMESCTPINDVVLQITVQPGAPAFKESKPVYTPASDNSEVLGIIIVLLFIAVLIIITLYIIVRITRDANSRGENGTMWGVVVFFTGLIGILIYFLTRPKGKLVVCSHCGKNKLEILGQCPHCKNMVSPVPAPTSIQTPAWSTTAAIKPEEGKKEISESELEELKEKLQKTNRLLDKLDVRLVQGELTEKKYKELSEKYRIEADNMKNLIAEKELLREVGLKDDN